MYAAFARRFSWLPLVALTLMYSSQHLDPACTRMTGKLDDMSIVMVVDKGAKGTSNILKCAHLTNAAPRHPATCLRYACATHLRYSPALLTCATYLRYLPALFVDYLRYLLTHQLQCGRRNQALVAQPVLDAAAVDVWHDVR